MAFCVRVSWEKVKKQSCGKQTAGNQGSTCLVKLRKNVIPVACIYWVYGISREKQGERKEASWRDKYVSPLFTLDYR